MASIIKDFPVYRTKELSAAQKKGICELFEAVFHHTKTLEYFDKQFGEASPQGSYHCIYESDGEVLATFSYIPYRLNYHDREISIAVGVDTAVSPSAKIGEFGVYFMFQSLVKRMEQDGIKAVYGFPNDNFYGYNTHILGLRDIGILDFYVIPMDLGLVKKGFSWLNPITKIFSLLAVKLLKVLSSGNKIKNDIYLINDDPFKKQRYSSNHSFLRLKDGSQVVYTLYQEDKLGNVAYIIDIESLSKYNFYEAFEQVTKKVGNKCSMVAFPTSKMPFFSPIRVPMKYLPRKLHMVGTCFDPDTIKDDFYTLSSWKANLSIFDVR